MAWHQRVMFSAMAGLVADTLGSRPARRQRTDQESGNGEPKLVAHNRQLGANRAKPDPRWVNPDSAPGTPPYGRRVSTPPP
jgi:hypothetical protein